jgi:bacterial/archaeal transporter family protein
MTNSDNWFLWALLSAVFAAFTAIFAKIGIQGVDSDLATLVRTVIITCVLSIFIWVTGKWSNPLELSAKTWLFLGLSGISTGVSWVCYFRALQIGDASQVAPVDKNSTFVVDRAHWRKLRYIMQCKWIIVITGENNILQ